MRQHRTRNLEIPRCAIAHLRFVLRTPRNDEVNQAARMFDRNASISARSTSASRRSAPEAVSTSPAAVPASVGGEETPPRVLGSPLGPPAGGGVFWGGSRAAPPRFSAARPAAGGARVVSP